MLARTWIVIWLLWLAVALESALIGAEHFEQSTRALLSNELERIASALRIELNRYRGLPQVVGKHPLLAELLLEPTLDGQQQVNELLLEIKEDTGGDAVYLMAGDGLTVASSNWMDADSFLGQNLSYRPYFKQSIAGQNASYFALGTTSGIRGYYFASPLMSGGQIIGSVVVKVSLEAIEQHPIDPPLEFLVTDTNGIIFFSSRASWIYRSLADVPAPVLADVMSQRQFGNGPIAALTDEPDLQNIVGNQRVLLPVDGGDREFLIQERLMPEENWYLITLAPLAPYRLVIGYVAVASAVYFLLVFVWLYWRARLRSEEALRRSHDQLERRVQERTADLQGTNAQLRETITKFEESEASLRQVQRELVQAEKLAVLGEMSAGINHEINQPLTALRSYANNSLRFLERGNVEMVMQNLKAMLNLIEVMAKIVRRFKIFSRKSKHKLGPVSLSNTLRESLDLLQNRLAATSIRLQVNVGERDLMVMADTILLEQVIVNILNNAMHAVRSRPDGLIRLSVEHVDRFASIVVEDNGPGVDSETRQRLFEPFFTTKESGLGLGLAISLRIVESFGGTIEVKESAEGGASFNVRLPLAGSSEQEG